MSSEVNMTLEDIIQKKKRNKKIRPMKPNISSMRSPIDARNKIISKRRNQFIDAREKLMQKAKQTDARLKLQQLREKRIAMNNLRRIPIKLFQERLPMPPRREHVFTDISRQVSVSQHGPRVKRGMNKLIERNGRSAALTRPKHPFDFEMPIRPLIRTVNNDIMLVDDDGDDLMIGRQNVTSIERTPHMTNLKIVTHNTSSQDKYHFRRTIEQKERSPQRLPSILKKRPMAALRSERKFESPEVDPAGYRIIVSNLRNIVTSADIQELFGGIGGLKESRLVRTGTAEVIYKTLEDAQKAVDLYHNRQLDGQPMNCLLVNPRSQVSRSGLPVSSSSNVEPDLSTFHKVLFSHL